MWSILENFIKMWYNLKIMKKLPIVIIAFIVVVGGVVFVFWRNKLEIVQEPIPTAQVYESPKPTPIPRVNQTPDLITDVGTMLREINLAVPFTVQAPYANWEDPYGDFCEEASVLMAASYINDWDIPNADLADKKLHEIKDFEIKRFGYHKDTTVEETASILREFYKIEKVKIIYDPTSADIKKALSEKRVIIIPAAGRQLENPYFRQPGPLYHMLVIKGYTKEGNFITNDPGTKRGADFIYKPEIILNAIHDWNGGDVENGQKVMIVVG